MPYSVPLTHLSTNSHQSPSITVRNLTPWCRLSKHYLEPLPIPTCHPWAKKFYSHLRLSAHIIALPRLREVRYRGHFQVLVGETGKLGAFYQDGLGSSALAPWVTHLTGAYTHSSPGTPEMVDKLERKGKGNFFLLLKTKNSLLRALPYIWPSQPWSSCPARRHPQPPCSH